MVRPPSIYTRRRFLRRTGLGLAALGGVGAATFGGSALITGCTLSDPTVAPPTPGPAPASSASPTASAPRRDPALVRAAAAEQALAELAAAIVKRKGLSGDQRRLLNFLAAAHGEHAQALAGPDPSGRPLGAKVPNPKTHGAQLSISGRSTAKALDLLAASEAKLGASHRAVARSARGATAILWGSLAVGAESYAAALDHDPPAVRKPARHRRLPLLNDVEATQELVRQLHAIIYGYQVALGHLSAGGQGRARARRDLTERRALRDRLVAELTRGRHAVPAAAAAYVPSPAPTSNAKAVRLARSMETALLPFCGILLAAAGSSRARERALTALRTTSRNALAWGGALQAWPGYPD